MSSLKKISCVLFLLALAVPAVRGDVSDTVVCFNEIMYHPSDDPSQSEWIELFNQFSYDIDLSSWTLQGAVAYTFADGTSLTAGGYMVVALDPDAIRAAVGTDPLYGPYVGRLANGGEEIRLVNHIGRVMDALSYEDRGAWPVAPDGSGATLAKRNSYTPSGPAENWTSSARKGGTPGRANCPLDAQGRSTLLASKAPVRALVPVDDSLGLGWTLSDFDDPNWLSGETGIGHVVEYDGPFRNDVILYPGLLGVNTQEAMYGKQPGCYARIPFWVEDPDALTTLTLRIMYDAGFVAYLNGGEISRSNVPSRTSYDTVAVDRHSSRTATVFEEFDVSAALPLLRPGRNLLAIHAMNESADDPDFLLLPELHAQGAPQASIPLAFNEVAGLQEDSFWVELMNCGNATINLEGFVLRSLGATSATAYQFPPQEIAAGGFLLVNSETAGFELQSAGGERLFLETPGGKTVLDAVVVEDFRARYPDGTGEWLTPSRATPGEANQFEFQDGVVINEILYNSSPQGEMEAIPPVYRNTTCLAADATWNYEPSGADLGSAWREVEFVDTAWASGKGLFGKFLLALPDTIRTPLQTAGQVTYYFRKTFEFNGNLDETALQLDTIVDDGVVFYLNGIEVLRLNMPDGPVTYETLASENVRTPQFTRPLRISSEALRQGTNVLAAEVHQASPTSSDVVFGVRLLEGELLQPEQPAQHYTEDPLEWIELYNTTTGTIDLGGWRFAEAIDFTFPGDAQIGPDAYLIVTNDASRMRERAPQARILSGFAQSLANGGERLLLLDSVGNPADEVHYYDEKPWPYEADGSGSSLELRDPLADNSKAEAWAPSIEENKSEWREIVYRGYARQGLLLDTWQEIVIGMLDTGEVLIDDLSVIRDPDGANIQLLPYGDFESEYGPRTWRLNGNHRLSRIEEDPDDSGNRVLHVNATGATNPNYNNIERTLPEPIQEGVEYEVSLRARWLRGSNQLNLRLFFGYMARTLLLDRPTPNGTPGEVNSTREANIGPTFADLRHAPIIPGVLEPVTVSVRVQDPDAVTECLLHWAPEGYFTSGGAVVMSPAGPDRYEGTIPGQSAGTVVQFYVEAQDARGARAFYPAAGPESRALVRVDYADGASLYRLPTIRLIMTERDFLGESNPDGTFTDGMMNNPDKRMSNFRYGSTVVDRDGEVYYDVGVREKGGAYSRPRNDLTGYHMRFNADRPFRGIHEVAALDRSPDLVEILAMHAYTRGGLPSMYNDLVYSMPPRASFLSLPIERPRILMLAQYNSLYLDSQWDGGGQGTVYNYDLQYQPIRTVDGDPEGLKVTGSWADGARPTLTASNVDITNLGDSKEDYRWTLGIKSQRRRDAYADLMALAKTMSLPAEELEQKAPDVMDVDQWLRHFAMVSLVTYWDVYTISEWNHNLRIFIHPDGVPKPIALPWDLDNPFAYPTYSVIGERDTNMRKLTLIPGNKRLYYGHMRDMIQTGFNGEYLTRWARVYTEAIGQNLMSVGTDYAPARAAYVLKNLPSAPEEPTFAVTSPESAVTTGPTVHVSGRAWIDMKEIRQVGRDEPIRPTWTSTGQGALERFFWEVELPVPPGSSDLTFVAVDFRGSALSTQTVAVESTYAGASARESLRVTEIMAAPSGSAQAEFIELKNIGDSFLDLRQVSLVAGVDFAFIDSTTTPVLAPGAYAVVVQNREAFEAAYGRDEAIAILGEYSGKLANEGERLALADASGEPFLEFVYSDGRGWPVAASGSGHSLVPLDSAQDGATSGSLHYGGNWRASACIGGSPGVADPEPPLSVVLNEIAANTVYEGSGRVSNDWIEIYNPTASAVSLDGWFLSDDVENPGKWALPTGLSLASRAFMSFDEATGFNNPEGSGFRLNEDGESVLLSHLPGGKADRVADAARLKGQERGTTLGRWPDAAPWQAPETVLNPHMTHWLAMAPTRGSANAAPRLGVLLSEIMYHPGDENPSGEFIEIVNASRRAVALHNAVGGWRLDGAVAFAFDASESLAAGEALLVVSFDPVQDAEALAAFLDAYGIDPKGTVPRILGPYDRNLSNRGERLAIEKPQRADPAGEAISWVIVDEAIYFDMAPWPEAADGTGQSLQRLGSAPAGNDPDSWIAADPSPGRAATPNGSDRAMWVLY